MSKPVCLGLSILELSKILMFQFWYDYVKLKHGEKAKLCYMDIGSYFVYINRDDIYENIAVTGLIKDKLGGKIMTQFVGLRGKTYIYLTDHGREDSVSKGDKIVCHKKKT